MVRNLVLCLLFAVTAPFVLQVHARPSSPIPAIAFPAPSLSPNQRLQAHISITQQTTMVDNEAKLAEDVAAAAAVTTNITQSFASIQSKLLAVDNQNLQLGKFAPQWTSFSGRFNLILSETSTQALTIARYAALFDQNILPTLNDSSLSADNKRQILQEYIEDTQSFQTLSNTISTSLTELSSDITSFTGTFNNFASNKTQAVNQQIQTLLNEIGDLQAEIANIQSALLAISASMTATLFGSAAALIFFPIFAPAILVAAAVAEGVLAASEVSLSVALAVEQSNLGTAQGNVQTLKNQIANIDSVQWQLNQLSNTDIAKMSGHISLITTVWEDVADECTKLIGWLQDGADDADMPDILAVFLLEAKTIFTTLSTALQSYGTQINPNRFVPTPSPTLLLPSPTGIKWVTK
ncbi:hypothetical protein BV25DRAFT_1993686 [Artomyces pyxidatus]|uniref:Uncharacterized protein n=1 Tax=Artomyces pyxidatus TaxID=48021 RepID=A0ACB8STG6_9AGAM|nr:hypothetical protein BV25DRAFT_1993686 [Artomyces pyxidatus]